MKNTLKTFLAVAALGVASSVSALVIPATGTVEFERTGFDGGLSGGEFVATVNGTESFITFCLEKLQSTPNSEPYEYGLSLVGNDSGRHLTAGSGWLYEQFIAGNLADYDTSSDSVHYDSAGYLQKAFWMLEGYAATTIYAINNPFIALVNSHFSNDWDAATADYTGVKVRVMNLTPNALDEKNGRTPQDVLVYVPDSGATLVLLGLGLAGLAVARRRR